MRTPEQWLEIYERMPTSGHRAKPEDHWAGGRNLTARLKTAGAIRPGGTVMDLGCGPCKAPPHLVEREGMRLIGIDCNRDAIDYCQQLFPDERFEWLDVRNDTYNPKGRYEPEVVRVPVEDQSCDLVVCASFFTHLGTLAIAEHYLSEIFRVLKPGGFFFSSWFRDPPWEASSTDAMTVFKESEIVNLMKPFRFVTTWGGLVGGPSRNQWHLITMKPES